MGKGRRHLGRKWGERKRRGSSNKEGDGVFRVRYTKWVYWYFILFLAIDLNVQDVWCIPLHQAHHTIDQKNILFNEMFL